MTTTVQATELNAEQARRLGEGLITFLQTNTPPDDLFRPDVFCDLSLPHWRMQTDNAAALVSLRRESHPDLGLVSRWRVDPLRDGFVFEFEERWTDVKGESWYAREMIRATVTDGQIAEMSIYCTGDWDRARQTEHKQAVNLLRP